MRRRGKSNGFSLVELLVAVAVVGLLTGVAFPA
ncbi:MAG: prepilin-type N-terminal cleavage/methylation domain-containing protein, partial [Verrucomicrobia bacterium]|nr:prepilin-type N-terminal cleavage/methylation domain-containing protein [Verrucomicrobiota bacterium]NDA26967.1 prepilin-type N-terminal cleavage/methylation domain-containing protein [Verrucomicrobiota bacterium]